MLGDEEVGNDFMTLGCLNWKILDDLIGMRGR